MAEEHQWVVMSVYELSRAEIESHMRTHERMPLAFDRLMTVEGPGCFKCEMTWEEGKDKPCKGGTALVKDTFPAEGTGEMMPVDRRGD